jgi:chemotaxis protein methyltransferase CheR
MSMTTVEFDYLRKLVREQSAIVLDSGKEYLVEARLAGLVREQGMSTVTDLVAKLRGLRDGPLHTQVVEAITTNETLFFRDPPLWDTLRREVLPELVERRRGERRLQLWSAACSSGQEPYSLAMLLAEHFGELAGWEVHILATDLSTAMLARAQEASYSQLEVNRGLPAAMLVKHFSKEGMHWRVVPGLRRTVEFRPLNLGATWPPLPRMDLVLLRNVLIYFDAETKRMIAERMRRQLRPDGYLVLGAAENLLGLDEAVERVTFGRTICYRPRQDQGFKGG